MQCDIPFPHEDHAVVGPRGLKRLNAGHPWVYAGDIARRPPGGAGVVQVHDSRGRLQGYALYSPASTITLRLISREGPPSPALITRRIDEAAARRERLMPEADAYRVVHGEADFLPGVFVDRYGDAVTLQTTCGGADILLPALQAALVE
ncbi:MAG TPA: class I SAM-dependent rRNA methyltransferase, partial [Myxococcota bacterium]|nr:class I SAM-dependent rRNA methyltransferase [Myxococcota bacterium]